MLVTGRVRVQGSGLREGKPVAQQKRMTKLAKLVALVASP